MILKSQLHILSYRKYIYAQWETLSGCRAISAPHSNSHIFVWLSLHYQFNHHLSTVLTNRAWEWSSKVDQYICLKKNTTKICQLLFPSWGYHKNRQKGCSTFHLAAQSNLKLYMVSTSSCEDLWFEYVYASKKPNIPSLSMMTNSSGSAGTVI